MLLDEGHGLDGGQAPVGGTGGEELDEGIGAALDLCEEALADGALGLADAVGARDGDALEVGRVNVAARGVGIAQRAFELAIRYSQERKTFGRPIAQHQAIQFKLADMATKIEAARALVYSTARMIDAGVKDVSKESAMAKVFASDVAMEVTTNAVQIFGGYGYMKEYPVEKMMRDAKITQIYEGTNQIQREVIGSAVIKESAAAEKRE